MNKTNASTFAIAAAALFLAACEKSDTNAPAGEGAAAAGGGGDEIVKCMGINECKGQSLCNTATTSCAGENECAGKGWIKVAKSECDEKGGEIL